MMGRVSRPSAPAHSAVTFIFRTYSADQAAQAAVRHLALAGERNATAHRGVSTARDGEEALGELEGGRGRCGHAVGENNVPVDVDDGNRDGYVQFQTTRPRRGQRFPS